jgi:uncharacterized membrane protein
MTAARRSLAQGHTRAEPNDPFMATFDRGVALAAYGLLFLSPFMLGAPAIAGFGMAYAHKNDSHSLMRSHYRFQIRIFWTTLVCLVIGLALAVGAGGIAIGAAYHFLRQTLPALGLPAGGIGIGGDPASEENWLLISGVAFLVGGVGYVLIASLYGFIKLLAGRPIRHRNA